MEIMICKCGEKVCGEGWIGDWGNLRVFKSLEKVEFSRTSVLSECVGLSIHCTACMYQLGYYIISTPNHLSELLDKFCIILHKPSVLALKSLYSQLSHVSESILTTQGMYKKLETYLIFY